MGPNSLKNFTIPNYHSYLQTEVETNTKVHERNYQINFTWMSQKEESIFWRRKKEDSIFCEKKESLFSKKKKHNKLFFMIQTLIKNKIIIIFFRWSNWMTQIQEFFTFPIFLWMTETNLFLSRCIFAVIFLEYIAYCSELKCKRLRVF